MNNSVHAFTDASVLSKWSVATEVWCSVIFVDGDIVSGRRLRMPDIVEGVGLGLTSSSGEQWAVIQAVLLADPSRPLTIFSDVSPMVPRKKASVGLLCALYFKATQARVMPVERILLPIAERNRGFHKWAHQLARGDLQERKITGKAAHQVRKRMTAMELRRDAIKQAELEMMEAIPFVDTPPTKLERAITGWSTPGVGHTYY